MVITFLANTQRRRRGINSPVLRNQGKCRGQSPVLENDTNVVPNPPLGEDSRIILRKLKQSLCDCLCAIKVGKVRVQLGGRSWLTLGPGSLVQLSEEAINNITRKQTQGRWLFQELCQSQAKACQGSRASCHECCLVLFSVFHFIKASQNIWCDREILFREREAWCPKDPLSPY